MRVPLSWLKEYVDVVWPIERLAERLTLAGLEVDSIHKVEVPPDRIAWDPSTIVVGEVLEVKRHPNADRLVLAVVDHGGSEPEQVVTGAPNLHIGDSGIKVPFARRGAHLYDGHQDGWHVATLKPSKIRGIRSEAMICSEKELGLYDFHEQVVLLPSDAPVGQPLAEYMDMDAVAPPDLVLDLGLTPNLARCYNIIGVAREVAALTGRQLRLTPPTMQAIGPAIGGQIDLEIDDPDLCNRYSATLIKNVKIGPSPYWMQHRLNLAGMRPINNIVDITNYVMLEWGQPLHAFDYDRLRPRPGITHPPTIIVRRAKPGETMTTLDGQHRQLTPDMLMITDGGGPVAVAGVMGGLESEVEPGTTDILLEAANFNNINNRKTAQVLKLPSEASLRFGKGVPASSTVPAATRASELMRLHAGGVIAQGIADAYPVPQSVHVIDITADEVARLGGIQVGTDELQAMLESLEFKCERQGQLIRATAPDHRLDVEIPADIVEDVTRLYGYDRIPLTLLTDELPPQRRNLVLEGEELIRDVLIGCGLDEVITYALTSRQTVLAAHPDQTDLDANMYLKLANPLTTEREYLRRSLLGSLLETLRDNFRFLDRVAVFEVGRVYWPRMDREVPDEPRRLGLALGGPRDERAWIADRALLDFYDLKGAVETVLDRLAIADAVFEPVQAPSFHPGRTARLLVKGRPAGLLGQVHPLVCERFDLPAAPVWVAELDLEVLLGSMGEARRVRPISRFPSVAQDLALILDEDIPASRVRATILEAGGELLADAVLFDLYRGDQLGAGKKSLAYSLTYRAMDRTLTDAEVSQMQERIVQALEDQLGAALRA